MTGAVERLRDEVGLRTRLVSRARGSVLGRTWAEAYDELVDVHWSAVLTTPTARTA